jgi:hypothetical protein
MKENSVILPDSPEARELARLQTRMLRPAQEVNREGSFELGWGLALLCFGIGPYYNAVVTKSAWYSPWTTWLVWLPFLFAVFAPYAVPKLIKRFITWPRTGYVAHPNDVKLIQLVMLLVFSLAVGGVLGQLFVLVQRALVARGQPALQSALPGVIPTCIELLIYSALAVYLGRKVIRKRTPLPTAYDAAIVTQGLQQTAVGRRCLRVVKFAVPAVLILLPILAFGVVFALIYWSKSLVLRAEFHWSQLGIPGLLVAANALLYFMGSGVVLKPNRWKWFLLPAMLLVPILVGPAIPYPAATPGLFSVLHPLPPVILCIGSVWFLSGAIALILFMHRNRLPPEAL